MIFYFQVFFLALCWLSTFNIIPTVYLCCIVKLVKFMIDIFRCCLYKFDMCVILSQICQDKKEHCLLHPRHGRALGSWHDFNWGYWIVSSKRLIVISVEHMSLFHSLNYCAAQYWICILIYDWCGYFFRNLSSDLRKK